jgi:DNA-binding transcriptional LysR family regulator
MISSRLSLHSLIVFYFVASEASVTAAAEKLCLTQPTITYHIRTLEKSIGLQLLDVRRQKVILTHAGEGLFKYVSEIYQSMLSAEKFLESLKDSSLRVGISSTFSSTIVKAAAAFEEAYPEVKLIIKNASSFEVAEEVYNSRVDLGIVVGGDYGNNKLKHVELSPREKLVLVASPSSNICQKERVKIHDLCGYPLILGPETSATRRIILNRLRLGGCHMPAPIIVEVNNSEWGINLIKSGKGMSIFHDRDVKEEIAEGRLKALSLNGDIWVGADALLRENAPEHPMVNNFISLVKEAFISQN